MSGFCPVPHSRREQIWLGIGAVAGIALYKLFGPSARKASSGGCGNATCEQPKEPITIGYWKIRGLAASLRMMCYYNGTSFTDKSYGEDAKDKWFGKDKPALKQKNGLINLPYIVCGEDVTTQSNSCLIYLGERLGIDDKAFAIRNHQALDQIMDLRNDTMKIVYGGTPEGFPDKLAHHMKSVATHLSKLEAFVVGCGCGANCKCADCKCAAYVSASSKPQSADFHLFEMIDQHIAMVEQTEGVEFDFSQYPKLMGIHAGMKKNPKLAKYFASDFYTKYAFNNAMYTQFVGAGYGDGPFGPTTETHIEV